VRLWQAHTGAELLAFRDYDYGFSFIAFSPTGKQLVSNGADRIAVWQTEKAVALPERSELVASWPSGVGSGTLANALARRGRWEEAIKAMAHAIALEPTEHLYYHGLAPMLVKIGDLDGYRKLCQREVAAFQTTKDPIVADRMSKSCSILPDSGVSSDVIAAWADLAISATNHSDYLWYLSGKGLADYRRGDFSGAVKWLADHENRMQASAPVWSVLIQVHAVAAMAYSRLNQADAARKALSKAVELQRRRMPKLEKDPGELWLDWIIGHALLNEAIALIGPSAPQTGGESP
jgi:tetratricopeptide (TPR) repeat protein